MWTWWRATVNVCVCVGHVGACNERIAYKRLRARETSYDPVYRVRKDEYTDSAGVCHTRES